MFISIRDGMLSSAGYPTMAAGLRGVGLTSVELSVDREMAAPPVQSPFKDLVKLNSKAAIAAYQAALAHDGFSVCALLLANDFARPDLAQEIQWVVRCAQLAKTLGCNTVRIDAIMRAQGWSEEQCLKVFADAMKQVIAATEDIGTQFGIENHGARGNEPSFLKGIIASVGSPRLGVTLDTANFYWSGKPLSVVHEIIHELAPFAKHTHVKNINYPADMRETQRVVGYEYGKLCCAIPDGDNAPATRSQCTDRGRNPPT